MNISEQPVEPKVSRETIASNEISSLFEESNSNLVEGAASEVKDTEISQYSETEEVTPELSSIQAAELGSEQIEVEEEIKTGEAGIGRNSLITNIISAVPSPRKRKEGIQDTFFNQLAESTQQVREMAKEELEGVSLDSRDLHLAS